MAGADEGTRPIPAVRRLVVKVGSSSLVDGAGVVSRVRLGKVVREVAQAVKDGRACVLVSSGAIVSGLARKEGFPMRRLVLPVVSLLAMMGLSSVGAAKAGTVAIAEDVTSYRNTEDNLLHERQTLLHTLQDLQMISNIGQLREEYHPKFGSQESHFPPFGKALSTSLAWL